MIVLKEMEGEDKIKLVIISDNINQSNTYKRRTEIEGKNDQEEEDKGNIIWLQVSLFS